MSFFKTQIAIILLIFISLIALNNAQTLSCSYGEYSNGTHCLKCYNAFPGCGYCYNDTTSQNKSRPVTCSSCLNYEQKINLFEYRCDDCPITNCNYYTCNIDSLSGNATCGSCKYGFYYNESSKQCLNCSEAINNCNSCNLLIQPPTEPIVTCQTCFEGYFFNSSSRQCIKCSDFVPNCAYCNINQTNTNDITCYSCSNQMYYNKTENSCQNCQDQVQRCTQCSLQSNIFSCSLCENNYGNVFIKENQTCFICNETFSGCQSCSYDSITQQANCEQCLMSNYGFNKKTQSCQKCSVPDYISRCQKCGFDQNGTEICLSCYYYQNNERIILDDLTKSCQRCSSLIPYCLSCEQNPITRKATCSSCMNSYYINNTDHNCYSCKDKIPFCSYCYHANLDQITCNQCENGFLDQSINQCIVCNQKVQGCRSCYQNSTNTSLIVCTDCGYGQYFDSVLYKCSSCDSAFPGCRYCYNSWNSVTLKDELTCGDCGYGKIFDKVSRSCKLCDSFITGCRYCYPQQSTSTSLLKYGMYCSDCGQKNYFNSSESQCMSCESKFKGCLGCYENQRYNSTQGQYTSYVSCYNCGMNRGFDDNTETCRVCSEAFSNCTYCGQNYNYQTQKNQFWCYSCIAGFMFNPNKNSCESCNNYFPGCKYCYLNYWDQSLLNDSSRAECYDCGYRMFFNRTSRACEACNKTITGCGQCYQEQYYDYTYINKSDTLTSVQTMKTRLTCWQCANSNKGYNPKLNSCEFCSIRENCDKCAFDENGLEYCQQCAWGHYYNPVSKSCQLCSSKVKGCQYCYFSNFTQQGIECYSCQYRMYLNQSDRNNQTCQYCSDKVPQCQSCWMDSYYGNNNEIQCYECGYAQYYNRTSKSCMNCGLKVRNCQQCYQSYDIPEYVECYECTYAKFYNSTSRVCSDCNTQVQGCTNCTQDYYNSSRIICNTCIYQQFFNSTTYLCENCQTYIKDCEQCSTGSGFGDKYNQIEYGSSSGQLNCTYCKYGMFPMSNVCTNCSDIIPGCQYCYNMSTGNCKQEMYCSNCGDQGKYYSLANKTCLKCEDKIKGCMGCNEFYRYPEKNSSNSSRNSDQKDYNSPTSGYSQSSCSSHYGQESQYSNTQDEEEEPPTIEFQCWWCGQNKFYNNITQSCDSCSATIQNCLNCYYDHYFKKKPVCSECIQGMFYDQNYEQCVSCSSKYIGCQNCYGWFNYETNKSEVNCWQCMPGMALNYAKKMCVKTMACEQDCDVCEIAGNKTVETVTQVYKQDPNNSTNYIPTNVTKSNVIQILQCTLCSKGFILDANKKCIYDQNCQPGKYFDGVQCQFCKDKISDCFNCKRDIGFNVTCTSCFNDFQLLPNLGICNATKGIQNCPPGCQNCTYDTSLSTVQCTVCSKGFVLNATTMFCEVNCTLLGLNNCKQCTTIQNKEANFQISKCDLCWNGFALTSEKKCSQILDCGENKTYYAFNGSCISCPSDCLGCKNIAPLMECDFCSRGFIVSQDKSGCIPAINNQTIQCPPYCTNCVFNSKAYVMSCTACEASLIKKYYSINNQYEIAKCGVQCDTGCLECFFDKGQNRSLCAVCDSYTILNSYRNCVLNKTCSFGKFYDPNQFITYAASKAASNNFNCTACPTNCTSCRYSQSQQVEICTYCNDGNKLTPEGKCIPKIHQNESSCPEGNYDANSMCRPCPENCAQCSLNINLNNQLVCSLCKIGFAYIKDQNACLQEVSNIECKPRQFTKNKVDPSDTKCYDCGPNCNTCVYDKVEKIDKCITCDDSNKFFLTPKGVCLNKNCPEKYIFNPQFGCEQCPNYCKMCTRNTTGFLACLQDKCEDGYTLNQTTGLCVFDETYCQKNNKTAFNNVCLDCPLQCNNCTTQVDITTSKLSGFLCYNCNDGFKLQEGQCVRNDCLSNQYYGLSIENLELSCYNCTIGCATCKFDRNSQKQICTSCSKGYDMNGTQCFFSQASGTGAVVCAENQMSKFDKVQGAICVDCPASCSSCFFDESDAAVYCKTCIKNFALDEANLKCLPDFTIVQTTNCTFSNQTFDYISQSCVDCPIGCNNCKQTFSTDFPFLACTNCSDNYTWFTDWKCYRDCPEGEVAAFFANKTQFCRKCMANCKTCDVDFKKTPALELCYVCEAGFYLQEGVCEKYPLCNDGQFLTLNFESYLNYSANCKSCPSGCVACAAQNPTDQYSKISCLECNTTTHSKNALGNCVVNYFNTKDEAQCDTEMGFYKRFERSLKKFICEECPQGCQTCEMKYCFSCYEGYNLENQQCHAIQNCSANQFFSKTAKECKACPSTCASCVLIDVADDSSLSCTNCISGYDISEGSCVQSLEDSDVQLDLTICDSEISKYLIVYNNAGLCIDCPFGCTKCKLDDPYDIESTLTCSSCKTGYNFLSENCFPICQQNEFFIAATSECQVCHFACKECIDETDKCLVCNDNYAFSQGEGSSCVLVTDASSNGAGDQQSSSTTSVSQDCGVDAYFDFIADTCVCSDAGMYFDDVNKVCNSVESYTSTCSIGQFFDEVLKDCLPCTSRDEKGRCSMCSGPSAAECQECIAGYYLDSQTLYCLPCAPGCLECTSLQICSQCQEGYYKYIDLSEGGDATLYCYSSCPVGTLPYLPSFYYLNPSMFSEEEIEAQMGETSTISSANSNISKRAAQAINAQQDPIYDNLPWSLDAEGFPTYLSQRINLECVPCLKGCLNCIQQYLFIPDQQICSTDAYCPGDYVIFKDGSDRYCVMPQEGQFATSLIDRPTLTLESGVQPLKKDLYIDLITTCDNGTLGKITYQWSILGVKNDIAGIKLANPNTKQTNEMIDKKKQENLKKKFLDEVKLTEKTLTVPASNLQQFLVYCLKVESTLHYDSKDNRTETITEYLNITVRNVPQIRKTEDLGVQSNLITVAPTSGISGDTKFKAKYSICNAPAYTKPPISSGTWKFVIKVQPANSQANNNSTQELIMQSNQCSDYFDFVVPANKKKDQNLEVQFMFSFGENYYQTVRKIKALANPNFKLSNSQSIQKLNSSTNNVKISESDLAQSASLIQSDVNGNQLECPNTPISEIMNSPNFLLDGPCNTSQSNSCCGFGTCVQGLTTTFRCQCNEGYSGQFCNIQMDNQTKTDTQNLVMRLVNELKKKKISKNNVDSIVSTIKQIAQMQSAMNSTIMGELLLQLQDAAKQVTDTATLTALFEAIQELQISQLNSEVSSNSSQAFNFQKDALDTMTSAVQNSAKQLSKSTPESSFSTGKMSGKTKLVSASDVNGTIKVSMPSSDKAQSMQIGINKTAMNGYSEVAVSTVVTSSSLMSSANGSKAISSDNIEISLVDTKSGSKIPVKNLTGECPISFNMLAKAVNKTNPNNTFQCVYLNNGTYSTDGCNVSSTKKIKDETYQVSCCCNHLSLFSTKEMITMPTPTTPTNPSSTPSSPTSSGTNATTGTPGTPGTNQTGTTNNTPQTTVNNGLSDSRLMNYLVLLLGLFVAMVLSI